MGKSFLHHRPTIQAVLAVPALVTTALVLTYCYLYAFTLPWLGFEFSGYSGEIFSVDTLLPEQRSLLQPGDLLKKINGVEFRDYARNAHPELVALLQMNRMLDLEILRSKQTIHLDWYVTPIKPLFSILRMFQLLPGFAYLVLMFVILLLIRPADNKYILLNLCFDLTTIWIFAAAFKPYNFPGIFPLLKAAFWLCMPVYIHFAWHLPKPLKAIHPIWKWVGYALTILLLCADLLHILPDTAHILAIFSGLFVGVFIILLHRFINPLESYNIRPTMVIFVFIMIPYAVGIIVNQEFFFPSAYFLVSTILPGAALATLYTIYQGHLGNLELRINQAIIIFLYFFALQAVIFSIMIFMNGAAPFEQSWPVIAGITSVLAGIVSVWSYPRFSRWSQRHILRIPVLPDKLLQEYAGRITTSLQIERLSQLICQEVFPSLLIRQGALLRLNTGLTSETVALLNVEAEQIPPAEVLRTLADTSGVYRLIDLETSQQDPCPWVRLVLKLCVEGRLIGICLLGRRDPDDFYSMTEIPVLEALMSQTALALHNIEQAERLRKFHQANIERHENERMMLAMELHDEVLGKMALMAMNMPSDPAYDRLHQAYQTATDHVRSIINGLRPTMISYGLGTALHELADDITSSGDHAPEMDIQLMGSATRYPADMEMHLYRISQQACNNAIRHGQPRHICISGQLADQSVDLVITDDGQGFDIDQTLDLSGLLAKRHFGLAGIYERAALIGATVQIDSRPQAGTKISVHWEAK